MIEGNEELFFIIVECVSLVLRTIPVLIGLLVVEISSCDCNK